MNKLSKHNILPLASILASTDYNEEAKRVLEQWDAAETQYTVSSTPPKAPLTKHQQKSRNKNKAARKARKRNK